MDNELITGMILYKNINSITMECLRVLNINDNKVTLIRLNDNKLFKDINIDKIKVVYNILNPHIVISHIKCEDTDRLLIRSIRESKVPNYIYDDTLKYHYSPCDKNIIGFKYISNPLEVNKLHLYYIDNIKETLDFIIKYNPNYITMKNIINDDILMDIYDDNNIIFIDKDIEYDNDLIIEYNLGLNLNTIKRYKIIHAKNGIFINK